jgi:hypothetical protein
MVHMLRAQNSGTSVELDYRLPICRSTSLLMKRMSFIVAERIGHGIFGQSASEQSQRITSPLVKAAAFNGAEEAENCHAAPTLQILLLSVTLPLVACMTGSFSVAGSEH